MSSPSLASRGFLCNPLLDGGTGKAEAFVE